MYVSGQVTITAFEVTVAEETVTEAVTMVPVGSVVIFVVERVSAAMSVSRLVGVHP